MILIAAGTRIGRPSPRRSGLTLIEVLLALAIFLMALIAIAALVDMGTEREVQSQFRIRASRLAQAKMGEVVSGSLGALSTLSSDAGSFDNDTDWNWSMSATPQGVPNLYIVQVTVSRDFKGQQFQFVLTQMAMDPYMMGSGAAATTTSSAGSATSALYGTGLTGGTQ